MNWVYHEIDFPVNTASKIRAIRGASSLQGALGITENPEAGNVSISETGDALHSPWYHIHPVDLRSLPKHQPHRRPDENNPDAPVTTETTDILKEVDTTLPTLLISECCLVYLSPTEADDVVHYFTKTLFANAQRSPDTTITVPLGLILYEPIRPDDPFGRTMVSNLATRGIHLQTLHRYASLEAQRKRLSEQGFDRGQEAADVDFIWERWVSENEKERVARLEMLDEMEEWRLLARHYCIAWGWREGCVNNAIGTGAEGEAPASSAASPLGREFVEWTGVEGQAGG